MKIKEAKFLTSSISFKECPNLKLPEFALIGRSNVGKSSLINMLFNNKKLAKVSSMPGKTQLINHFLINNEICLVDLPGYGWSKVSKAKRSSWNVMINDYLLKRKELFSVFVLIDSRLEPQKIDIEFINWLGINKVPFSIIFTKIDKISKHNLHKNIDYYKGILSEYWEILPLIFTVSSLKKIGGNDIFNYMTSILSENDCNESPI